MGQYLVVAVIVALAVVYAASKYLPAGWRQRIVYLLTRGGASAESKVVRWFDTGSSCGSGCDSCKACAEPAPTEDGRRVIKLHERK
jgi:hypothetical protein